MITWLVSPLVAALALPTECLSPAEHTAMMSLSERAFDQDLAGGWRKIAAIPGCEAAAADLIKQYRAQNSGGSHMLTWHEGQLRSRIGEVEQATRLFSLSRVETDSSGWNHYVDATIAFLNRDRQALVAARARLIAVPKIGELQFRDPAGNIVQLPWPPNLNVVDGLLDCFGRPYWEAYTRCATTFTVSLPDP